ncbi:ABC transporter substrate-binding protein [Lampropedia puyangensis]|uniref:ABC transporter substrate-binding protein n=1 Tax=Lampropedia puyangensis TaxID=1330072 RepID=A0A4S8F160_9BURK|nr:extracellular solute-binding protein [Lampropedia puyangensis]THU01013.1 ABC transporter substrate-binding protein [Lampropedia puyangensis]
MDTHTPFSRLFAALATLVCLLGSAPSWAAHAYAQWGEPKYPSSFTHFDYVNPLAPKGGEIRLISGLARSSFDKYNPFTMRGSAPSNLLELMFESLLTLSMDETATGYGLLAESVDVAADRLSATFVIRQEARFHNGKPVLAEDVKYSYETLISSQAAPLYASVFAQVKRVVVVDERVVRFEFKRPDRDLPLTVGGMPVFSRDWGVVDGVRKPFDEVVMDTPIGSGPYTIGPVVFGRDITYVRDPNYWGAHLNVNVGSYNFDRVTIRLYQDATARLEALKAGEFDAMQFFSAGDWARRTKGRKFDSGELVKAEFEHHNPAGFQSYFLNLRRPLLQDARVRKALNLALDYEWLNQRLFFGSYQRVRGIFGNTQCQAEGAPSAQELALLQPWRKSLPAAVFEPVEPPPRTDTSPDGFRANLRQAQALLAQAGWRLDAKGVLRNADNQVLELELMDSNASSIRAVAPWIRNLEKLGITLRFRAVDYALYLQRTQQFDFDITSLNLGGLTHNPGQEYLDLFGTGAAITEGSYNFAGINNPAIDAVINHMSSAQTHEEFLAGCRALERIVVAEAILIPQWYAATFRAVYNARLLQFHSPMPAYVVRFDVWAMSTWWYQ